MNIDFLKNYPQFIELVIHWLWSEWGQLDNYLFWDTLVKSSLYSMSLPQIYVAVDNSNVTAGTVSLWRCDLLSRQDFTPWLACLYVTPQYRKRGVGQQLQNFCCRQARKLGFCDIYLFSELQDYYELSSWKFLGNTQHELGFQTKLYTKKIEEML